MRPSPHWANYEDARDAGELRFRLSFMPGGGSEVYAGLKTAGVRSGFGDESIRIGAVKFSADGSASERTMYMSTPYEGTDDHGILTMTQEQIDAAVDDAVAHGFRVGIHANGDLTIDMVLKAYERVLRDRRGRASTSFSSTRAPGRWMPTGPGPKPSPCTAMPLPTSATTPERSH